MKKVLGLFILLAFAVPGFAQHQELNEKPGLWKENESNTDSTSILSAFQRGRLSGHLRYYFMATDNAPGLTDYYAQAAGGGIKFETAPFKNLQLGVSGFFTFNIGSSDLALPDTKTQQPNRYEIGLFDIEDPLNKSDINRLEELYLKYNFRNSKIIIGKQLINTPFINLQDGRMRPTEVEGLWTEINQLKNIKIEAGYLYGISPRSTVKWYSVGESFGVYPPGVNPNGTKSDYRNNLDSKAIALLGINYTITKKWKLQLWNQYVSNIFNSLMLQADFTHSLEGKDKVYAGFQAIRQDAIRDGGNADPGKTYFTKGSHSQTFGAKTGWKNDRWDASLNYNRITSTGRYLQPREWGRDPFFTFLPRERNEGLGDVHAWVTKLGYSIPRARLTTQLALGYYDLPDVNNFALNKYGLPSYTQVNIDIRYAFAGLLKGLGLQLLYVYKDKAGNTYGNDKYVINKVDMSLYNLVLNYHF